ncbi:putative lipase ROG1 isoform X2 [Phragmites australis]|uniref:putative lipase ROG1 isoform X2 n=1 Tax=Phragmites australis TaxID=29695 RepID=UPI002D76C78E|nr:putative lipase ROG1 isoform X2 [Phragmites australis]
MGDLGGGDWRDEAAEEQAPPAPVGGGADHLVVMVHGIVGSTADWKFGAEQFDKLLSDKVIVHCSNRNMHKLTLDGIDVMGERLAQEVIEETNKRPHIKKISFVAHSVGGLVARYAIGRLYRPPRRTFQSAPQSLSDGNRGTIHGLEAVNFITVASPHLGSRGNRQVPFLFGVTAIESFACCIIHLIFGRTGKHLFFTDNDDGKPPLLQCMVDDWGDLQFMSALQAFKRRVAYSNVGHDHIVGWRTSSIRRDSELPMWVDSTDKIYPHIVHEELSKAETPNQCADVYNCTIEELLLRGLKRVSWEKVDVSFHNSKVRSAAHSVIQVKDPVMHCEGADVIQHMIDHFILE